MLTGEKPEVNPLVARRLAEYGHEDFTAYVVWACEKALERGLLPHTNLGVLDKRDLGRLREVTASQGLMLESISERLMETVHAGSPTKHPQVRLQTIKDAGELSIPSPAASSSASARPRRSGSRRWRRSRACTSEYGHIQEIILQNFVPHDRYYGRGRRRRIADQAARTTGAPASPTAAPTCRCRAGPIPVTVDDDEAARRRRRDGCCRASASRSRRTSPTGGTSWSPPARPTSAGSPPTATTSAPSILPEPAPGAQETAEGRRRADRAALRLPAVHRPGVDGAGRAGRREGEVLELHPAARLGRSEAPFAINSPTSSGRRSSSARTAEALTTEQLTALFAERRPEAVEAIRAAADELRAELAGETVTFVVNRNINISNVCTVGCAFCGFGQGKRSPDAYEHDEAEFRARVREALDYGATELCIQSGIHPDWAFADLRYSIAVWALRRGRIAAA